MSHLTVDADAWYDLLGIAGYLADVAKNRRAARTLVDEFESKCEVLRAPA